MTIESTPWLDQLSALEQENELLKLRLQACETACARLQAEVMRYRSDTNQLQNEPSQNESINAGQNRDRLLEMTAIAANTLLTIEDFDHAIGAALQIVGAGLETDRVTVIEVLEPSSGLLPAGKCSMNGHLPVHQHKWPIQTGFRDRLTVLKTSTTSFVRDSR